LRDKKTLKKGKHFDPLNIKKITFIKLFPPEGRGLKKNISEGGGGFGKYILLTGCALILVINFSRIHYLLLS